MNAEEIRKKAIECGENLKTMCISNTTIDRNFNAKCADNCEYTGLERCGAVYGYEHGFADGVEEGKKRTIFSKLDIDEQYEVSKQIEADIRADERKMVLEEVNLKWDSRVIDLIKWCKDGRLEGLKHADLIFAEILEQMKEGGANADQ